MLERSRQFTQIAAVSGDCAPLALEYLGKVLRTALKDRLIAINPQTVKFEPWSTNQSPPVCSDVKNTSIGLVLTEVDSTNQSPVIRGPAADSPSAKNFRGIWGGKAEERRFKDGSIAVAAFFDGSDPTGDAVKHLVKLHGEVKNVKYFGESGMSARQDIADHKDLMESWNELESTLRRRDLELPLQDRDEFFYKSLIMAKFGISGADAYEITERAAV